MNKAEKEEKLQNWTSLNTFLTRKKIEEKDVKALLEFEKKNQERKSFIVRLHAKLKRMEMKRERKDIL